MARIRNATFGSISPSKDVFLEGHFERNNGLAREIQRSGLSVEAFESFSLDLAEEVFGTRGNVVDEMAGERFLLGERLGFAHGALGTFDVASALGCEGAHEGGSVVLDFAIHLIVRLDLHRPMSVTGCAAPAVVPGAMAAMSADSRINIPAEPACPPVGVT